MLLYLVNPVKLISKTGLSNRVKGVNPAADAGDIIEPIAGKSKKKPSLVSREW